MEFTEIDTILLLDKRLSQMALENGSLKQKLRDAEEDFDTLVEELTRLRNRLASAEAERDILQWASDHSGGGGESSDAYARASAAEKRYRDRVAGQRERIERLMCSCDKPDPYDASFKIETGTDPETVIGDGCDCGIVRIPESPERPHEALVWAILYASSGCQDVEHADDLLEIWRYRWPEPKA